MRVVIAPDSFKGSLDAAEVAAAIVEGWRTVRPDDELRMLPQADGGEGTMAVIASAVSGAELRSAGDVTGPHGKPVPGHWLQLPDGTAVVELARASGLPLMSEPDPLGATTQGLGEVILAALDAGARRLVIGLGGSASTDGGAGALAALGMKLLDSGERPIGLGGGELARLARIDASELRIASARLLTDVTAPLLGPSGAAAVFGPQKGASPDDVRTLEDGLAQFAELLGGDPLLPGSGAAGGTGYGFSAAWGAPIEPGAHAIAELTGLTAEAASADLVITGEGRFDRTSTSGKVVGNVLELAGERTRVIAGQLDAEPPVASVSLSDLAGSADAAIADPARWLREAAARLAATS